mmetsp:Transcript_79535/g.184602  ORF Transcript_79535/g.184602 Transcript_79535/m.184602 type:complete len:210 (-) Transcript_79535:166-795(-)
MAAPQSRQAHRHLPLQESVDISYGVRRIRESLQTALVPRGVRRAASQATSPREVAERRLPSVHCHQSPPHWSLHLSPGREAGELRGCRDLQVCVRQARRLRPLHCHQEAGLLHTEVRHDPLHCTRDHHCLRVQGLRCGHVEFGRKPPRDPLQRWHLGEGPQGASACPQHQRPAARKAGEAHQRWHQRRGGSQFPPDRAPPPRGCFVVEG